MSTTAHYPPPPGLAERTCEFVASRIDVALTPAAPAPGPLAVCRFCRGGRGFSGRLDVVSASTAAEPVRRPGDRTARTTCRSWAARWPSSPSQRRTFSQPGPGRAAVAGRRLCRQAVGARPVGRAVVGDLPLVVLGRRDGPVPRPGLARSSNRRARQNGRSLSADGGQLWL